MTESGNKNTNGPAARPCLDAAFPSIRLMAAGVFLVVAALIFSGWNMVQMGKRGDELIKQKEALEKEKTELAEYLDELPILERRHADLSSSTTTLEKEHNLLTEEVARLTRQRQEIREMLEKTQGTYHVAQSARREAQQELHKIITEIEIITPKLITLEARLAVLKAQEHSLAEALAGDQTQKIQLAAEIKGLERERAHAEELLARLVNDRKTLQGFSDAIKVSARDLNEMVNAAGETARKFSAVTSSLDDSSGSVKTGAADLAGRIKNLDAQIALLADRNQALAGAVDQHEKTRLGLKSQLEMLTVTASSLTQAGKLIDAQALKWARQSDKTLTEVGRVGEALAPLPKNLETALKSLSVVTAQLNVQLNNLDGQTSTMRTLVTPLRNQAQDFSKTAKILRDEVNKTQKSGETLLRRLDELRQSVEEAQELMRVVSARIQATPQPAGELSALADSH